jgi:hypothetical protein
MELETELDLDAVLCNSPREPFSYHGHIHEWEQTTDTVVIYVTLPAGVDRSRQLSVRLLPQSMFVIVLGGAVLLHGTLYDRINAEVSDWEIVGLVLVMNLRKAKRLSCMLYSMQTTSQSVQLSSLL